MQRICQETVLLGTHFLPKILTSSPEEPRALVIATLRKCGIVAGYLGALHPASSYRFSALYRFSASHPLTALLIPQLTWELATMDGLSRPMQMCSQLWHPIKHRLQVLGCAD